MSRAARQRFIERIAFTHGWNSYYEERIPPLYPDNSRLEAFEVYNGCFYFDGKNIPYATARVVTIPQLLNDTSDGWTNKNVNDLTNFIIHVHDKLRDSVGIWFHYSVLYLLQALGSVTSNERLPTCTGYRPSFTPALNWTGRDTYLAAFLWVASVFDNPEREQQPPTSQEFSHTCGLSRYQQWQYLEHMRKVMRGHPELKLNVTRMAGHGFMYELPVKIGEAWWDRAIGHEDYQKFVKRRECHPSQPLPDLLNETGLEDVSLDGDGLLPKERQQYQGHPNYRIRVEFCGPDIEWEYPTPPKPVPPREKLKGYDLAMKLFMGQKFHKGEKKPEYKHDVKKRWNPINPPSGPTFMV